jgi:DNA processing protein
VELARPRFEFADQVFGRRFGRAAKARCKGVWAAGSLAGLGRQTVAVVGARAPSDAARARAQILGEVLARAGVCVISGLALGIDGAAHLGALAGGTPTVGAVISPFAPDEPARPGQFLQRNGIVAALADAVVVVEAAERSGALNTAGWAADLGVEVLAYPGDVDRPKAAGCNALIRDGATLVRGPDDVLEAIGLARIPGASRARGATAHSPVEQLVLEWLANGPNAFDAVAAAIAAPVGEVSAALVTLEIAGAIRRESGTTYALA